MKAIPTRSPTVSASWRAIEKAAAERFGIEQFRPGQRELIEASMAGRNALGILPTGAGKSLCFQLPALFLDGTVVVVSPLIALMQDQIDHLDEASIAAARLDSTVSEADQKEYEQQIRNGVHDIVIVTPERLQNPLHLEPLKGRVALLVVDEAHCVSQWGHDFRPAYLELRQAIKALGNPPVLALTATAPPDLIEDIRQSLGLDSLQVVQAGIERANLMLEVARTVNRDEKEHALEEIIETERGPGIIYVATIKRLEEIHGWLRAKGILAGRYHGKMSKRDRQESQRRFASDELTLMVATNAFGLGIDKPNVRFVVHWHFPGSLESYYQEAGRAGRDGLPARCILFYRLEDKRIRSFFLGGNRDHARDAKAILDCFPHAGGRGLTRQEISQKSALSSRRVAVVVDALERGGAITVRSRRLRIGEEFQNVAVDAIVDTFDKHYLAERERLEKMMRYAETALCRTQFLREYFGEPAGEACGHCDNCLSPPQARARAPMRPGG